MVTRGDTIADRLTHPHKANVELTSPAPFIGSSREILVVPTGIPKLPQIPPDQKSHAQGEWLHSGSPESDLPLPLRPELRLVSTVWASIRHKHPLQRSTRSTSSRARRRAREWRHRTTSRRRVRCDRSSSRRMRDSGIDSEAETDVFHARVINAWGEDAKRGLF